MSPDERREQGPMINGLRDRVAGRHRRPARPSWKPPSSTPASPSERIDLTLPAPPRRKGGVHPTMQVMDEMIAIFAEMGFAVAEGPDIEDDFHNFTALNFPPKHPAREMHDTFFLKPDPETGERKVLRTHTCPVQVRTMLSQTAADPHHRAGPHLPEGFGRHPHADVPPDRGSGDRPGHPHGPPEVDAGDLRRPLLRDWTASTPASARTTSPSPSPRPRWTSAATARAAS